MIDITEDSVYIATLNQLKGIGQQSTLRIIDSFPSVDQLQQSSPPQLEERLGKKYAAYILAYLDSWDHLQETTLESLRNSAEKGIIAIPITSDDYPPLLRLIDDPPPILYAKGSIELLKNPQAVAIVGTREPTEKGREMAYTFAQEWVSRGYIVVSGLAKGIDTAAHQGALDANGKTIAILGNPLDKIYPAENKALAQHIIDTGGLLLSELMVGQNVYRNAFVARDRLQSGLSLCVFPVQTTIDGGTMHAVRFAEKQRRFVFCLRPPNEEASAKQYEGIWALIHDNKKVLDPSRNEHIEKCLRVFSLLRDKLLHDVSEIQRDKQAIAQLRGKTKASRGLWETLDGALSKGKSALDSAINERKIRNALDALGLDNHTERFRAEAYHLTTLFSNGQSITQALETISDTRLLQELRPFLYCIELSALITAAHETKLLNDEQTKDMLAFLRQVANVIDIPEKAEDS